jgi:hypothetical protein
MDMTALCLGLILHQQPFAAHSGTLRLAESIDLLNLTVEPNCEESAAHYNTMSPE